MFRGKKLLILGGSYQHIKLVQKANELGIETYVTDYLPLEKSPAKQIAKYKFMYDIFDLNSLAELCRKENIDGVIAPYLDVTQIPYQQLCEKMGYFCFGDKKQHEILTNKKNFKLFCINHGANVIDTYDELEILKNPNFNNWPVIVKPADSRGSRGQTVCNSNNELIEAINFAKIHSKSNETIIEKYMGTNNDLEIAYIVINGEPVLLRVEDRYLGKKSEGFDKLCIASICPSKLEKDYIEFADSKIKEMIKAIDLKNSPVFIQAFMDRDTARLYDPGIRLPGDDFDVLYKYITGIDIPYILIKFALTGEISESDKEKIKSAKINKPAAIILPCLKPGKISAIYGYEELKTDNRFLAVSKAYNAGDIVEKTNDVRQRFGEFDIVCSDFSELKNVINELFKNLKVLNENGENMITAKFDTDILDKYIK